jgi:formylglycine-generating enzyme required for sulfatase activity
MARRAAGWFMLASGLALTAATDPYDSLLETARTLEAAGNLVAARQTAAAAIAVAPNRFEAHLLAGGLARKQGSAAEAQTEFEQALKLAPPAEKPRIQALLGAVEPAPSSDEQRTLDALVLIAREADAAPSGENKRRLLRELVARSAAFVQRHPECTVLWMARAQAALELNLPKVGREAAQKLLQISPPSPELRYLLVQLERRNWTTVLRIRTTMPAGPAASAEWAGKPLRAGNTGIKLRWIAPGRFKMGTTQVETNGPDVQITRGFWVGETEVTQEQWEDLMGTNPSNFQQNRTSPDRMTVIGNDRPVEQVTWFEASEFCSRLNAKEQSARRLPAGYEYRLPTEAEWEYACRAGTIGDYHGPELDRIAWFDRNSSDMTQDVARKRENAWGLHDMSGNVAEWCYDWFADLDQSEYTDRVILDPDPDSRKGAVRVIRGGSWLNVPPRCQSAARAADDPGNALSYVGFRVVLGPAIGRPKGCDGRPRGSVPKLREAGADPRPQVCRQGRKSERRGETHAIGVGPLEKRRQLPAFFRVELAPIDQQPREDAHRIGPLARRIDHREAEVVRDVGGRDRGRDGIDRGREVGSGGILQGGDLHTVVFCRRPLEIADTAFGFAEKPRGADIAVGVGSRRPLDPGIPGESGRAVRADRSEVTCEDVGQRSSLAQMDGNDLAIRKVGLRILLLDLR